MTLPCTRDPEAWFPEKSHAWAATRAKRICNTECAAVAACLAWAVEHHIKHGVWGGRTAEERKPAALTLEVIPPAPRKYKVRLCGLDGCERKHHSNDLCNKHLLQARRAAA